MGIRSLGSQLAVLFAVAMATSPLPGRAVEVPGAGEGAPCELRYRGLSPTGRISHPPLELKVVQGAALSVKEKKSIRVFFDELAALTEGRFHLPSRLKMEVSPPGDWADYLDGTIHLPKEFRAVIYRKHPRITRIVLSHEWGHALFESQMEARYPEIAALMHRRSVETQEARAVYAPYDELFADTVAVLQAQDGQAARDVLFSSAQGNAGSEDALLRDFTVKHRLEGWSNEGLYSLLSPTRSVLWEKYLSRPGVGSSPGASLHAIFDAIAEEVAFRLENPTVVLSPQRINERLIEALERRFGF